MTTPAGEGFIIIRADLSRFGDELRRGVNRALDEVADDFLMFERFVSDVFEDIADSMVFHMRYADRIISRIFANLARDARMCGLHIAEAFALASHIAREELDNLQDRAERAFRNIRRSANGSAFSITGLFRNLGRSIFTSLGSLFGGGGGGGGNPAGGAAGGASAATGIMSSLSGLGGIIGSIAQIAVMAVVIPLIIQLGAALINLLGIIAALPAALGVAAAAFIPLKLAFNGFAEALAAVWEGDPEKINEAMKKLAPSTRHVVREFAAFVPILKKIGPAIQQGFFVPIEGLVTRVLNNVLPGLQAGLVKIGWVWGELFRSIGDAFTTSEFSSALNNTILTTIDIIKRFGPTMGAFATNFVALFNKGLPYVQRFAFWIAGLVDKFNAWLSASTQSGKITGWLETAWQTGKKLYELIKQLGIFVALMFGSFSDEGTDTMNGLGESVKKVNEYLRSPDGQEALHNLGVVIHWVGNAWVWFIGHMTAAYDGLNMLFSFIRGIGPFVMGLFNQWKDGWSAVADWTRNTWNSIKDWVISAWNATVAFLSNSWTSVKNFFVSGWNSITAGISGFFSKAKTALLGFPALLKQTIIDSTHRTAYAVGYAIGSIIRAFLDIPKNAATVGRAIWSALTTAWTAVSNFFTETIPALASNIGQWFADMWNSAYSSVSNFVTNSINTVSELPGRIGDFVSRTRDRVVDTFNNLRDGAVERVRGLVSDAREEASKLPGQIANAISSVVSKTYDIGRDMIYGMINGIRSAAHALWDAARSVVMDAWQGAKDALKSKSPSKKWAELGEDSAAGYHVGFDGYDLAGQISSSIKTPLDAFNRRGVSAPVSNTSVNVGGAQIVAYLQIGEDQLHPVVIRTMHEHPQEVALASQQGNTQLARRR